MERTNKEKEKEKEGGRESSKGLGPDIEGLHFLCMLQEPREI